jgi:hypothetical protein
MHDKKIKKGDFVMVLTGSANTDPEFFDDPLDFKLDREIPKAPLMFGHGVHRCVGMYIARIQLNSCIQKIVHSNFKYKVISRIEKDTMDCDGTIYKELVLNTEV